MLHDFALIHRPKPFVFDPHGSLEARIWSTCLRSLAFVQEASQVNLLPQDQIFTQDQAYRFLLEIICGLHSPILGETEVLGQFKMFAAEWLKVEPRRQTLVQRLLADAKTLRSEHLSHLGTQSYGSWLRRRLTELPSQKAIHVLGGGQLAREILPYLAKTAAVCLHVRRPQAVGFHNSVRALSERAYSGGALVIAAPLSANEIRHWLSGSLPDHIFDLRETSVPDPVSRHAVSLHDIFSQIEKNKNRLQPVVDAVKSEIAARSLGLAAQEKLRPQGWDDLCA